MNAQNLLDAIGDAKDGYVQSAMETRTGMYIMKSKRFPWKKAMLLAAVIAMTLMLVGCTVAYVLRLQELKIAEERATRNFDARGEWVTPTEVTRDVIAIRGYPGSSNHMATKEWYEFEQSYDPGDLSNENENGIPEAYYHAYHCYTWEQVEKVDEIAEKYDLKLLSPETVVQRWQSRVMFRGLGISGVCHEEKAAKVVDGAGCFYPEGNFKYEFEFHFPGEGQELSAPVPSTVYYTKKAYFDPDYMGIDTEFFDQWDYTTADGSRILIAMSSWGGYFFGETADAYMTVSVNLTSLFVEQPGRERQLMEQAAEVIDFTIRPQTPDMEKLTEELAKAEDDYDAAREAAQQKKKTYSGYASYIKEKYIDGREELLGTPYMRNYYALVDVTGDGEPELLLGREDFCFNDLLYIRDGKVVAIEYWRNMNLCENGVIRRTMYFPLNGVDEDYDSPQYYSFGRIGPREGGGKCVQAFEALECSFETRQWTWTDLETEETQPMTEEQLTEFLARYPLAEIEMKPISQFPMGDA